MLANFCLPKFAADAFKEKLKSGEINPDKLASMSSDERRSYFQDFLGEGNAHSVNALFESKLLLKNQQAGIINWAKNVAKLSPEVTRDILSKVDRMTEVLSPKDEKSFLEDLASQRLGVHVSMNEAGTIVELAKKVDSAKADMQNGGDRMAFGRAKIEFGNYVSDLKNEAAKTSLFEKAKHPIKSFSELGGITKSLKASLDNSAIFRQGWKTMFTHPGTWVKNAGQSFLDIVNTFGGKKVLDEVQADILSRPTYDAMKKAKLAIGTTEEAFPSHFIEKIPGLGKLYQASENAYTGFVYRMRADVFDRYLNIMEKQGIDITDKTELQSIGKLVNSLTGRGDLGRFEGGAQGLNNVFFSPRNFKANIDLLTAHTFDGNMSSFARRQAAVNTVKVILGSAAIMQVANMLKPGSVEWDPRSSDFGKIKIGDTRFDVSGGMASIATLAVREIRGSTKTNGKVKSLTSNQFGMPTRLSVLEDFTENKTSPVLSTFIQWAKGQDFNGNKPTLASSAANLFVPLPITNYMSFKNDPNSANALVGVIADGLGIGTNTYSTKKKKN